MVPDDVPKGTERSKMKRRILNQKRRDKEKAITGELRELLGLTATTRHTDLLCAAVRVIKAKAVAFGAGKREPSNSDSQSIMNDDSSFGDMEEDGQLRPALSPTAPLPPSDPAPESSNFLVISVTGIIMEVSIDFCQMIGLSEEQVFRLPTEGRRDILVRLHRLYAIRQRLAQQLHSISGSAQDNARCMRIAQINRQIRDITSDVPQLIEAFSSFCDGSDTARVAPVSVRDLQHGPRAPRVGFIRFTPVRGSGEGGRALEAVRLSLHVQPSTEDTDLTQYPSLVEVIGRKLDNVPAHIQAAAALTVLSGGGDEMKCQTPTQSPTQTQTQTQTQNKSGTISVNLAMPSPIFFQNLNFTSLGRSQDSIHQILDGSAPQGANPLLSHSAGPKLTGVSYSFDEPSQSRKRSYDQSCSYDQSWMDNDGDDDKYDSIDFLLRKVA